MSNNNLVNFYRAYQLHLNYHNETFPSNVPPPTYNEWYSMNFMDGTQQGMRSPQGNFLPSQVTYQATPLTSTSTSTSTCSTEASTTEATDEELDTKKRERWSKKQTEMLVKSWKHHFEELGSTRLHSAWAKIRAAVNKHGPEKSTKQIKSKIKNLKDVYKRCKDNNKTSG